MHTRVDSYVPARSRYQVRELVCTYRPPATAKAASSACRHSRSAPRARPFAFSVRSSPISRWNWSVSPASPHGIVCSRGTSSRAAPGRDADFDSGSLRAGVRHARDDRRDRGAQPPVRRSGPSQDDVTLTARLRVAGDVLEIALLDHLIVGEDTRYFSFAKPACSAQRPQPRRDRRPSTTRRWTAPTHLQRHPSAAPIP